jgi:dienelactone hydrolase
MIVKQTFTITGAAGRPILMDLTYNNSAKNIGPLVIFVHGFKGFKDWGTHDLVADYFVENGFRYLKFNFSHNGTTIEHPTDFVDLGAFGDNTFSKEFEDLDKVITFAFSESFPASEKVSLIGHSRGGGTCVIQAAKDERVDKLVTWAAISDFSSLWKKEQEDEWREKGVIYTYNVRTKQNTPLKIDLLNDLEKHANGYNILKCATKIDKPWLLLHGDADQNVALEDADKLLNNNSKASLKVIKGADHVFGAQHPYSENDLPKPLLEVVEKSVAFLKT